MCTSNPMPPGTFRKIFGDGPFPQPLDDRPRGRWVDGYLVLERDPVTREVLRGRAPYRPPCDLSNP